MSQEVISSQCPWGWQERRLPRELYTKLFVVHFVVIASYGHLMHLRGEKRSPLAYLFIITCPIAGTILMVPPLLAFVLQALVYRGHPAIMRETAGVLFGRAVSTDAISEGVPIRSTLEWPPKLWKRLLWRVVGALAIAMQCATSVWLFARRMAHDGVALYDQRVLELAILGLCTSLMTIFHEIFQPKAVIHDRYPSIPAWLSYMRPVLYRSANKIGEWLFLGFVEHTYTAIALLIADAAGFESFLDERTPLVSLGGLFREAFGGMVTLYGFFLRFAPVLIAIVGLVFYFSYYRRQVRGLRHFLRFGWRFAVGSFLGLSAYLFVLVPLIVVIGVVAFFLVFHPLMHAIQLFWMLSADGHAAEYVQWTTCQNVSLPQWKKIDAFGRVPPCCPCPVAWKDPVADYVWWLA